MSIFISLPVCSLAVGNGSSSLRSRENNQENYKRASSSDMSLKYMSKTRQVAEDYVELKSSSISSSVERLIRKESTA